MKPLEIDSQTNLSHILNELKTTEEDGLELTAVPNEATVLDNPINKAIIEKAAIGFNKEVIFPAGAIESAPEVDSDNLGFVEGEDILAKTPLEEVHNIIQPTAVNTKEVIPKNKKIALPSFLKKKWVVLTTVIVSLLVITSLLLYFLPSAKIELVLSSETKDSQVTLSGDTSIKEVEIENKKIPLKSVEVSKEDNDEITTTGKKTIGTYAKGRVTIYNLDTDNEKSFPAGSTILTPVATSSATFKLDNDVVLPKAPFLGTPSSVGVNVTAIKAGSEGNLAAGITFKVNSISNIVYAKNDLAFSGGSSKEVTVVSSADRETLKKNLVDKLTEDAKSELEKKNKDVLVPEDGFAITVNKETYDPKDLNAEAEKLKATIDITATTFTANRDDLIAIASDTLEKSAKGFKVDKQASKVSLQQTDKLTDKTGTFLGKIKAVLHPNIDREEINKNTTGKSLSEVKAYLDSIKNIQSYKVMTSPGFFQIFSRMPFLSNRIEISIKEN